MTDKNSKNKKIEEKENEAGVDELKIDECRKKIEELENQNKRLLADYRNLENRVRNERGEWIIKANKQLLLNILPVLDTLMSAVKHSKDQGLILSLQQFLDIFKKEGVEKIEAEGKVFDPLIMECVTTREGEEWKVLEETRSGYKLGDTILRPALVIVGKKGQ